MGWSNDQFAGTLVIPTGATTGARIEIDGTTGRIEVYDAADVLVYVIDGTIPGATAGPAGNPQVTISTTGNAGRITFPSASTVENVPARLVAALFNAGLANENISFQMIGPSVDAPANDRLELLISSQNADGSSEANLIIRVAGGTSGNLITLDEVAGLGVLRDVTVSGNLTAENIQVGTSSLVFVAVASVDLAVTFATAFDAAPKVTATLVGAPTLPAGSSALIVRAFNITTTGMTLRVNDVAAVNRTLTATVNWHAIDA